MSADGDADFADYVTARWSALVRAASYLGCSQSEAEDLVQTALIRCFQSWGRVSKANRVDAYVHRVLVTSHATSRRRRWHGEVPTPHVPEHALHSNEEVSDARADLHRALHRLSVEHRTVLVLRFICDLTERQTAEVLGVAPGTVKSRVSRAVAAIDRDDLMEETGERRRTS